MTNEEKILDILAGMSLRLDALEQTTLKTNIKIETGIEVKLDALADGHAAILERLVPTSRVDELEDRVKFLESMLRSMNEELQRLKKAL